MILTVKQKHDLILSLRKSIDFVKSIEPSDKGCRTCFNWIQDGTGGCKLANGSMPPNHVIEKGCAKWEWDEIPC